jgi:hypothetical protein
MLVMWIKQPAREPRQPRVAGVSQLSDLGSQLEDLFTCVMRCERWARFDDRLDLAFAVERSQPSRRMRGG